MSNLPETAQQAVDSYLAGNQFDAVPILPLAPAEQQKFWADVMAILARFPMPKAQELSPAVAATPELHDSSGRITQYANPGSPAVTAPAKFTYSMSQFSAWCFQEKLGQVRFDCGASRNLTDTTETIKKKMDERQRSETVQGAAFAILREGYRNVIDRRAPKQTDRIPIRKLI